MTTKAVGLIFLAVLLSGCPLDEKDNTDSSAPKTNRAESVRDINFNVSSTISFNAIEISKELESGLFHYQNPKNNLSKESKCIADKMIKAQGDFVKEDGSTYALLADADITSCVNMGTPDHIVITEALLSSYDGRIRAVDEFFSEVDLEGKSIDQAGRVRVTQHIRKSDMRIKGYLIARDNSRVEFTRYHLLLDSGQQPDSVCLLDELDNCKNQFLDVFYGNGNHVVYSREIISSNIVRPSFGGKFYESGTKRFRINNWEGEVVYMGADVAPDFSATSDYGSAIAGEVGGDYKVVDAEVKTTSLAESIDKMAAAAGIRVKF